MYLYNTLSGKKELIKKTKKPLRLFVCGPTVYDTPHIGNYRTFLAFDALVRYLRARGYAITYLQNITDVDDKIIRRAQEKNIPWKSLARTYERAYHRGEKQLDIRSVSTYARATDYIPEIVSQVQILIRKGHAYLIPEDGYYFDITTFADYGKLSHRTIEAAQDATSRIDESVNKRNKGDFALWKFSKTRTEANLTRNYANVKIPYKIRVIDSEPAWLTELGWGRPGWHIEDTAITQKHFGSQYDMHGGAGELKFPHHEAEIAQQESASGKKPFVKLWIHTAILLIQGQKMSKSLHNFVGADDFLKKYDARVFRYMVLSHHYRSPIDYSESLALQSARALESIQQFVWKMHGIQHETWDIKREAQSIKYEAQNMERGAWKIRHEAEVEKIKSIVKNIEKNFYAALDDDFNTPQAFAAIFSGISALDPMLPYVGPSHASLIQRQLLQLLQTVGITLTADPKIPAYIRRLCAQRELYRGNKQFVQADALRDKIHALGYNIEDTPWGQMIAPKEFFIKNKKI